MDGTGLSTIILGLIATIGTGVVLYVVSRRSGELDPHTPRPPGRRPRLRRRESRQLARTGHTDFIGSDPRDGARVDEVPSELQLEFSDEMDPGLSTVTLQVEGGDSTPLELQSGPSRSVLLAAIPTSLDPGEGTTTSWKVAFAWSPRRPPGGRSRAVRRTEPCLARPRPELTGR